MVLATFLPGIATIHGHMSKYFVRSAATEAISRITAGRGGRMTRLSRPYLMAVKQVYREMAHTLQDSMLPACPAMPAAL